MVRFPPFLPSAKWYAEWLRAMMSGLECKDAFALANKLTSSEGKALARCLIAGRDSSPAFMGMAIEGGASVLKNRSRRCDAVKLSDHGNWRHTHIGTLEATYGRTPYFSHLMPAIRDCYLTQQSDRLEDFNLSLHNVIVEFLGINRFLETYAYGAGHAQGLQFYATAIERGEEVAASINPELSIVDAAMRAGQETLLALICEINNRQPV